MTGEPLEALARRVDPGSRFLRTWELQGGVSAQMTAFEIERADGRTEKLIARRHGARELSRNPRIAADEFRLLELLRSAGVPAPTPRALDAAGEILSTPSLVVDYVEGEPAPAGVDETELVAALATLLAEIHRIDADLTFLPRRELSDRTGSRPESPDERRLRARLASARRRRRNRAVLLHGDYWPGNTLWRDGRLVAVIDWEDAATGDPLADVANARLELLWALGIEAMEDFTRRYQSIATAVDFTDLPSWDLWADLRLSGRISEWGLGAATERELRARHETFLAQALERLPGR